MPKVMKKFEFTARSGRNTYDWDILLSGDPVFCEEGVDYTAAVGSFLGRVRFKAYQSGMTVRSEKAEGGVMIQCVPASEEQLAKWKAAAEAKAVAGEAEEDKELDAEEEETEPEPAPKAKPAPKGGKKK